MRPVVKIEDGEGGAQAGEGLQEEAGAGGAVQRRRMGEAGDAAWDEALRANAEAQAQAIRSMEQARLLEARVAELAAEVKIKAEALQSKDALLQAKDVIIQSKDSEIRLLHADNAEAEADLSQPETEKSKDFDLDIDDPYDCVVQQHLDLPHEIVSKISEQTKAKLDFSAIIPVHHFRSNSLANVDQTSIKVVLKYPLRSKYLLFDSKKPGNLFLLQGGRHDQLKEAATSASFLARKCHGIFTIFKRKHDICGDTNLVLLPEPVAVINVQKVPTV
jgi:hypothetical protein